MIKNLKPLLGSRQLPMRGAHVIGEVDPEHVMTVTLALRRRKELDLEALRAAGKLPLTRAELAESHGADPADVMRVESYAARHHLTVVHTHPGARTVELQGRTSDMQAAFGVAFKLWATAGKQLYRGHDGAIHLPPQLHRIVESVTGLDDRPIAKHFHRFLAPDSETAIRKKVPGSKLFTVPEVAGLYGFPAKLTGKGQCIGVVALGGGYRMSDLNKYFTELGLKTPQVVSVGVNGCGNHPASDLAASGEITIDIEVAGSVAQDALIAVYFAKRSNAGFVNAVRHAVHDSLHNPSVLSISWGSPESDWYPLGAKVFDRVLQEAAAVGMTVFASAGDDGCEDESNECNTENANFPGSSPHVISCGGTQLLVSSKGIKSEKVWNNGPSGGGATGGGVSVYFDKPRYQQKTRVPKSPEGTNGRGVPDIAGVADPNTGFRVVFGGVRFPGGGTSVTTPLYAGLMALTNEARANAGLKPAGHIHDQLYTTRPCHDIVEGNNDYTGTRGVYHARLGWDACSGLGRVKGEEWMKALVPGWQSQPK